MSRLAKLLLTPAALAIASAGCGGASAPEAEPIAMPTFNPSPDDPLEGMNVENEYEYFDKMEEHQPGGVF